MQPRLRLLSGFPPQEYWELDYYNAFKRFLFILSISVAAWRFGVKGGLIACSLLGVIILPILFTRLVQPNVWLDFGIFLIGIVFSIFIGKQGEMRRLLEKNTGELEHQAVQLNREITERKRAEEKIRKSEERYRLLTENATDVIWTVDIKDPTRLTYISPSVTRLLGYSVQEAMGKSMQEVFAPHSYAFLMTLFKEEVELDFSEQKSQAKPRMIEVELCRKDGSTVPVEIICSAVNSPDEKPLYILAIARDISNRRSTEKVIRHAAEEWRATFDSITDFISIHDREHKIIRVNKAFANNFNMKPEDIIGKYCHEVIHCTKELCSKCPRRETLETGKPASAEFYESKQGLYLQISTSPMTDNTGEVIGSVHIIRDITEHRQIEEQLIMTDRLASIGELASGIAHELNNPLTSVIGFSQLLLEEDLPDSVKKDLEIVHNEARRASEIVKNLLMFARKHAPVKQVTQLNRIIEDVLKLRSYEQRVSNIEVITNFSPNLPEIMVDYFQIQQVFLNIVINAESAMLDSKNCGTLTITTEINNDSIVVSFKDDGPGIDEMNMDRIFNPFFTTKEVGKGTGLGLSICHGIITEHKGKIYVKSELGKGATFVIELPVNNHYDYIQDSLEMSLESNTGNKND